ncbi:hypothetical protein BTM165_16470 [Helicobacter pylori]
MIGKYPTLENITSKAVMSYILKDSVIAKDEWFDTPLKQTLLYKLLVNKYGLIKRDELKSLYLEFKCLITYYGKRYKHSKMSARRTKMSNLITNKKLKCICITWLKGRGIKWGDIDRALKDLMKHCAISSIEKKGSDNE